MSRSVPALSTEQVAAFVELARHGSLQQASQALHLSAEGLRGRILALETSLGIALYEKARGRREEVALTAPGRQFLQKAVRFLDQAHELTRLFEPRSHPNEIQLVASHYLMAYVITDAVREFREQHPEYLLRLSTRAEAQIFAMLLGEPHCVIGACTPTDFPRGLRHHPWRTVGWSLVVPHGHRWAEARTVSLTDIACEPLIVFERGSIGRLHVLETFFSLGLQPAIRMEATSTPLILSMVDAGLGVSIVPTPSTPAPLRGLDVAVVPISEPIRPIETGLFLRAEWQDDPGVKALLDTILARGA
ncbi:LysR family transcriptional regulator [Dokdonella soli]|uniref:LysR family transcriptional regulator n=1 Tax=Dokdonella soli TaxID=529810 RepID=A0ABP3U6I8_9GAMM